MLFVGAWYGQDAHTSYFLLFYFFTLLPLKICFCGGVVWARCPYLLLFTLLLFYSFTFKDMLLWWRGMGKMPIPPTFYSFTFLLFYFFKVVLSFSFCSSAILYGSGGAVVIASEAR